MKRGFFYLSLILSILPVAYSKTISFVFLGSHASQLQAAEILQKSNYKATFYLNSKYLGFVENYINVFQADDLYNAGFDIGGNTYSSMEFSLTTPITTITEEICRDRATLIANGWQPRSFAYVVGKPSTFFNPITQQIVRDCGYRASLVSSTLSSNPIITTTNTTDNQSFNSLLFNSLPFSSFDSVDSLKHFITNIASDWLIFDIENLTPDDINRFTELINWLSNDNIIRKFDDVLNSGSLAAVPQSFQNTPPTPTPDRDGFIKMIIGCACFGILIAMILYVSISTQCKRSKGCFSCSKNKTQKK